MWPNIPTMEVWCRGYNRIMKMMCAYNALLTLYPLQCLIVPFQFIQAGANFEQPKYTLLCPTLISILKQDLTTKGGGGGGSSG